MRFPYVVVLSACVLMLALPLRAQSPNGVINGIVVDVSNSAIVGADVIAQDDTTGVQYSTKTNGEGIYVLPNIPRGSYRLQVSKFGFKTIIKPDIEVHVQDALALNFTLPVGSTSEVVTVTGGAPLVNTENAAVSTVVDRQFAENLPMNGRSFQTLITLTPGVVLVPSNPSDSGQFSVNGQRAGSNYWMVDGVSANIGIGVNGNGSPGNALAGTVGSFSVLGGTNSLVSVDALQEFRIQTSTYAPEFGRAPGGQISIVTRAGTNQFHGTVFDYLRNDILDASNWFNGFHNNRPLAKAKERQNDFGGTLSGPIVKGKTFFFFSYEGLRLRLPQTTLTTVPDQSARQAAEPGLQPFLNAYPLDVNQQDLGNGVAQFNASYSNPATLDAYSLRIDHKLADKVSIFGRYNYSPSRIDQRGPVTPLSEVSVSQITTQTATAGLSWAVTYATVNDLRFNYSRTTATSDSHLDTFGGAVPLTSAPFPDPFTTRDARFLFGIFSLQNPSYSIGQSGQNRQRQINVVDSLSMQRGLHSLKFGGDYRRLSPEFESYRYLQTALFLNLTQAETGNLLSSSIGSNIGTTFLFRNLGLYAQDTWRIKPRFTLTYGLRWELDGSARTVNGPAFPAVTGFNLNDLSQLALAPPGTPAYKTTYGNFAPRIGVAYQIAQAQDWQTVLHGGFGVFYDLASSEMGNQVISGHYPFGSLQFTRGMFPLDPAAAAAPPITPPTASNGGTLFAIDPRLRLPYTLQWNVGLEQALGKQQSVSASYIGSSASRLFQTGDVFQPNPNLFLAQLLSNSGRSSYNALQVQLQRRLSDGLQFLASYTWSHSIDTGSAGSVAVLSNALVPDGPNGNRGSSDFDIRNGFSAGLTYTIPTPQINALANALLGDWSVQNTVQVRSASPVDIADGNFFEFNEGNIADIRPDLVPGQPLYLYGSEYPGKRAINPAALADPPIDPTTGNPLRQGNISRNFARGFGATQWDLAVHRDFRFRTSWTLQFRAEMFNVLNHPNFGPPNNTFTTPLQPFFGVSTQMLGQSLNSSNLGGGALNPLYQVGGPRSIQFALKLMF
jgi:hypothetical protein